MARRFVVFNHQLISYKDTQLDIPEDEFKRLDADIKSKCVDNDRFVWLKLARKRRKTPAVVLRDTAKRLLARSEACKRHNEKKEKSAFTEGE